MTTRLLLLPRRGLRLRLQRLRIESDIEDVGIAGRSRRYRIHQIFGHQTERHAAALLHRHGGPVDLGGDRLLLHAGLHHRDTYRNLDGRRISRWASNDAALNTDSRGDLAAVQVTIARGAGDGRLITQIVADGLLAGRRYRIGGRAGHAAAAAPGQGARNGERQRNAQTARSTGSHRPHHQPVTHHPDILWDVSTPLARVKYARFRAL